MCGDYNVDLLKINSVQFNENYFDSIISSGYVPTITLPTRLSDNSSLIDNVFTFMIDPTHRRSFYPIDFYCMLCFV